jgi:hypothetical protein
MLGILINFRFGCDEPLESSSEELRGGFLTDGVVFDFVVQQDLYGQSI